MRHLASFFEAVKRTYFPRWDRLNLWKVEIAGSDLCREATGYCDSKRRTIFLSTDVCAMIDDGLRAFLIHEICHDVAAAGHNLTWARRMERAAKKADDIGEANVASILRSDILSYCKTDVYHVVKIT